MTPSLSASRTCALESLGAGWLALIVAAGASVCGCSQPPSILPDAGVVGSDGGNNDGGRALDAGAWGDGGVKVGADAGRPDAGLTDAGAPETISVCPASGATEVGINTVVRVQASAAIDAASVHANSVLLTAGGVSVPGAVSVSGQDLWFAPQSRLPADGGFTVTLAAGVVDINGVPLSDGGSWDFDTGSGSTWDGGFELGPTTVFYTQGGSAALALGSDSAFILIADSFDARLYGVPLDGGGPGTPLLLATNPFLVGSFAPSIAIGDGFVHAAWGDIGGNGGPANVWYSKSDPSLLVAPVSEQFEVPPDGYGDYAPYVAADDAGHVAFTWFREPSLDPDGGTVLATSSDQGTTFSTALQLGNQSDGAFVAYAGGYLVFEWEQIVPGDGGNAPEDYYFWMSSSPDGMTFSPSVLALHTNSHTTPSIALTADTRGQALMLYTADFAGPAPWYVVPYQPSTNSLGTPIQVLAPPGQPMYADLVVSPSGRWVLVTGAPLSGTFGDGVSIRVSDDQGATFTPPQLLDLGTNPLVPFVAPLATGEMLLVWYSSPDAGLVDTNMAWAVPKRPCQ